MHEGIPNLFGSMSSGASQCVVLPPAAVGLFSDAAESVAAPKSVKRTEPSSSMRIFAYETKEQCKSLLENTNDNLTYPTQFAMSGSHSVQVCEPKSCFIQLQRKNEPYIPYSDTKDSLYD